MKQYKHKASGKTVIWDECNNQYQIKEKMRIFFIPDYVVENSSDWEIVRQTFTTHDNAILENGERVYFVNNWHCNYRNIDVNNMNPETKYFAKESSALSYIEENKPKYSLKDVEKATSFFLKIKTQETVISNLKKLNK